jgi:HlyD family secretion protein
MKRIALGKFLPWLVVAVVIVFAVYRLKFSPMPVAAYILATGEVRGEVMGTGTLEARIKTTISPRIQEQLAEVLVDQNDFVKAGQLLARLDDGELKMQVGVAEEIRT